MRLLLLSLILVHGCGPGEPGPTPCSGDGCGLGPRIKLSPQGDFGHIVCRDEGIDCVLDFGTLQPGATAESWTVIDNVGSARLHLAALLVTDPAFEVQHPAVELDPGESLAFRLRIRIDNANETKAAELHFLSDARNGESAESGCPLAANDCSLLRVTLLASTSR